MVMLRQYYRQANLRPGCGTHVFEHAIAVHAVRLV